MISLPRHSSSDSSSDASRKTSDQSAQKGFSCVLCAQRKVKCDRRPGGCDNCIKARVPCLYKAPPPPRRRRKGIRDVDITTRLRIYENALRELGIDPEELVKEGSSSISTLLDPFVPSIASKDQVAREQGVLVSDNWFKSRYFDNGIWTSLESEFGESKECLDDSSSERLSETEDSSSPNTSLHENVDGLFIGLQTSGTDLSHLHPKPVQILKLWQGYMDNINPLVKVFHAPSIKQYILGACSNLRNVPRMLEVLMFAIYSITVESLNDDECIDILEEPKSVVRQRFRAATQQALVNASFLKTSNMMVLKALVLFILSLQDYDARILWILSGVAQRIAQRIGLHHDGETLGIPPFHNEMRRRLWWQIMLLEGSSQKLAGTGETIFIKHNVKLPSNLNDDSFFLDMKVLPKEHEGATEMTFFLIRCHVGDCLKRLGDNNQAYSYDGVWNRLTTNMVRVAAKDKAIDELEALLHRKFIQHCDPSVPWHFLCSSLSKCTTFMMRFMAHSAKYYSSEVKQSEKDTLFDLALQVIDLQNIAYTKPEMRGFTWYINMHTQWRALIYLLSELRSRTDGPQVEEAWSAVEKTYDFHPSFDKDLSNRALSIAINNLTLKAWAAFIAARGVPASGEPYFIQVIRGCEKRQKDQSEFMKDGETLDEAVSASLTISDSNHNGNQCENYGFPAEADPLQAFTWDAEGWNTDFAITNLMPDSFPLDHPEQMKWSDWDSLVMDFSTNGSNDAPIDFSTFGLEI